MNATGWAAVIAGVGVIMSFMASLAVVSYRAGRLEGELRSQMVAAMQSTSERLARIEGMFELRLKDG